MIISKPKSNTITALTIFLVLVFTSFFMVLNSLLSEQSYFIIKLILAPVLLAIGLLVLGKLLGAIKVVKMGQDTINVFYPITRMRIKIGVKDVLGWREEVIKTKSGFYREVKILYTKKKILRLSNKENTEYDQVVKYLKKKIKIQKT